MTTQANVITTKPLGMNPLKFALWLFIVSIVMVFASLTSAYIVRKGEGNWLEFDMPSMFYVSSVIIAISSVTMHLALHYSNRSMTGLFRIFTLITFALGLIFMYLQLQGWKQLVSQKVFFVGNPSGSFVYVLSGLHGAHIVAGLIFLLVILKQSYGKMASEKKRMWVEMCTTFWHFLDGLWLYLFLFLILNR